MVERLDLIFVQKVAKRINTNSNQLHAKSYVLSGGGGGQHILHALHQVDTHLSTIIGGFTLFPSFVALIHKNLLYVECTRYSRNIMLIYVQVL
jgi:hypothetical protein